MSATPEPERPYRRRPRLATTARPFAWTVLLAAFVIVGGRNLQQRRADSNEYVRVAPGPFGSVDSYLVQFGLSSALIEQGLADIPANEPIVFVRQHDASMFQEFSVLSYMTWPHRFYGVGCGDNGEPEYTDFAPHTDPFRVAIVDRQQAPAQSEHDVISQLTSTIWIIRTALGRPWASFCR